mgnify:CR=1 FL=1
MWDCNPVAGIHSLALSIPRFPTLGGGASRFPAAQELAPGLGLGSVGGCRGTGWEWEGLGKCESSVILSTARRSLGAHLGGVN